MHSETMLTHDEHHVDSDATDIFGFWLYIMTDCILFGCLFATFLVLNYQSTYDFTLKKYLDLNTVLIETFLLLASNFTFCLAMLGLYKNKWHTVQAWLIITFLLGASFVGLEIREFISLTQAGFGWDISGQASSFFTLVGTHGFHVSCGLFWILIMVIQVAFLTNQTAVIRRRMTYLGMFWNFLDIVWIFVFTTVYLMGAMT